MKNIYVLLVAVVGLFLLAAIACNPENGGTLNCATTTITPAIFKNNGTPQTAVLKIGLKKPTAGPIVFVIAGLGGDFTPNTHTATVKADQTIVEIPITFDGTTNLLSEPLVIAATGAATGTCTVKTTIEAGTSSVGLNCATTGLSVSSFKNDNSKQNTVLKVGLNNAVAGAATFAISSNGSDFTPTTFNATLTAGQTLLEIPLIFDGTTALTTETITVSSAKFGVGTCTTNATITATGASTTPALNCTATTLSAAEFKNNNVKQNTTLKVGLTNAVAGAAKFTIASSGSNFTPETFTATLTAGQTFVEIPLVFDGSTTLKDETITVSSANFGTAACTVKTTTVTDGATPALNCTTTALSVAAFKNSGAAQNTVLKVGLTGAVAGAAQFNIASSGQDFTPATFKATLTAGQTLLEIPLVFDGTSTLTSETITVSSTNFGTGVCTTTATIAAADLPTEINCTTTTLSTKAFTSDGKVQPTILKIGLVRAKPGGIKFNIVSSAGNFTPVMATATLTAGQLLVEIPLSFDGVTTATTETITVTAPDYATGSCVNTVTITPPAPAAKVTYATVNPIFVASCSGAGCHTTTAKPILVSNYAVAKTNGAKIVSEVVSKKMPLGGITLTAEQIKLIQQWQTDGFLEK
jgi:hypothetical protein